MLLYGCNAVSFFNSSQTNLYVIVPFGGGLKKEERPSALFIIANGGESSEEHNGVKPFGRLKKNKKTVTFEGAK